MSRIRTVKPEFFKNYKLYRAEQESCLPLRLGFEGLWTVADREGRFEWIPEQLKVDALPYDDVDFSRVLDALWTRGYVEKYTVNGVVYGVIPSFKEHQVINNRERASDLPEPNENNILTRESRVTDATTTPLEHAQAEGKGREQGKALSLRQPIPADWTPSDETLAFAAIHSLPHSDITVQKFKDHYAAEGKLTADPDASYRKWLANERRPGGTHAARGKTRFESDSQALDDYERQAERELRESASG